MGLGGSATKMGWRGRRVRQRSLNGRRERDVAAVSDG
jgi:hypothetical protein